MRVTVGAEQELVLGGEGLLHQGAAAFGTLEALVVPVALLIGQVLP